MSIFSKTQRGPFGTFNLEKNPSFSSSLWRELVNNARAV
jgi:hypothetical protein